MLNFLQYSRDPTLVSHVEHIGDGIRLVFDATAEMVCTAQRSDMADHYGHLCPTLRVAGANRKAEEWFGVEIDLTPDTVELALTLRTYPAMRLFPRVHFDVGRNVTHLDLPDVAASDNFATRFFRASQWRTHPDWQMDAKSPRMLLLVPATQWFILELKEVERRVVDDA